MGIKLIDPDKTKSVCRIGQGASTCAFLLCGARGFECAKGTGFESLVRENLPKMIAQADNCQGPPEYLPLTTHAGSSVKH